MSHCHHRETCRLCESSNVEVAVPIAASPIADAYLPEARKGESVELYPLDLYLCRDCGHVQLLDVVDPEVLFGDYIYTTSISKGLVRHFEEYAGVMVERFGLPEGAFVFEIGSNDGTLLRYFKERGMRVLGVDPASAIAETATAGGIPTIPAFFGRDTAEKILAEHGRPKLVAANNVFAHADNLGEMAAAIAGLLDDDGVFVFEVSYLLDILENKLFDTVYHEHVCYHSIRPLDLFLQRHGLKLFDVERIGSKGGSIRCHAQLAGGPHEVKPVVAEMLAHEAAIGLGQPAIFADYTRELEGIKGQLHKLLDGLKADGGRLAGFGASTTVTTLLHHLGLAGYFEFLADDNENRHGLVSPGLHLPVVHPKRLIEDGVTHVVILAWQYATPIIRNHPEFTDAGGKFIVPLPAPQIVEELPA